MHIILIIYVLFTCSSYLVFYIFYKILVGPVHKIHTLGVGRGSSVWPAPSCSPGALQGCPPDNLGLLPLGNRPNLAIGHL